MAVRDSYRDYVVDQLNRRQPVSLKRMFGGIGLYCGGRFFALIDNDTLYFKTGAGNRTDFEQRNAPAFQPFGPDSKPMGYHQLPADILQDLAQLERWMSKALNEATTRSRSSTRQPQSRSKSASG
jgi:DNA transformation protein and related proteins